MKETARPCNRVAGKPDGSRMALLVVLGLVLLVRFDLAGQVSTPVEELRTADQIRRLTAEQAAGKLPVRLRGVVTFFDEGLYSRFVQDDTAGIYLRESTNLPALAAGQVIEVEGETGPGEYAPLVIPKRVNIIGKADLPAAERVSVEQLVSGQEDSQFVEVTGIVRSARYEEESQLYLIDLVTGGEQFSAYIKDLPRSQVDELVDSTVRVRGVSSTLFNRQRQLFGFRLLVARPADLVIEKPAAGNPFSLPTQTIASLLQFTPQGSYGHRVKTAGTVIYQEPGSALLIQDEQGGLYAKTRQSTPLQAGDRVEVLGFPAKGEYTPMLQDAVYRKTGAGTEPMPEAVDVDETLKGTHDCRLVRLQARLLDRTQRGREQFLVLETGGFVFQGFLGRSDSDSLFPNLQNGSEVAVTGVCLIERGSGWRAGEGWRAKSFRLVLRSPADVVVLKAPPWWTQGNTLSVVGIFSMLVLSVLVWIDILRHRGRKQNEPSPAKGP